ncbi:hypothetical protein GW17_00040752 [Ensete ventricosum]|nr:hypothetical protein GW17_00040752 [Ensete ventricosum]
MNEGKGHIELRYEQLSLQKSLTIPVELAVEQGGKKGSCVAHDRNGGRAVGSGHLNLIADVHNEGIGDWLHRDPGIVLPDLEAGDVIVDEEDGHAAGVGVRREPECELRLRAPRVEVDPHADPFVVECHRQAGGVQSQAN